MVNIIFKNQKKSTLVKQVVSDRLDHVLEKFPSMAHTKATVTVSTENSRTQPGVDDYAVKLILQPKRSKPIILEKHATNLYSAVAELADRAVDILHRALEKRRDHLRASRRELKRVQPWKDSA